MNELSPVSHCDIVLPGHVALPFRDTPESLAIFREVVDQDRVLRASLLSDVLDLSTSGAKNFHGLGGIPIQRYVIDSHLYRVSIGDKGEVEALVRQYQRGHDDRFGQRHSGYTGDETLGIMQIKVDRDVGNNPYLEEEWNLSTRFLKGEALRVALAHYNWLYRDDGNECDNEHKVYLKESSTKALAKIQEEVRQVLYPDSEVEHLSAD
ncbi:MAG: hypothetical protein HY431_02395 [Candidatus Levybacteria bacterium]|nr:hypothetical protein [Candidatus Levybacteria bacterium]